MPQISIRPGDSLAVAEDITIRFDRFNFFDGCSHLEIYDAYHELSVIRGSESESAEDGIEAHLRELSKEIMEGLSSLEPSVRDGLLGTFVRELYYSAAAQDRSERNHRRQADGIAAAKARGARFGRPHKTLPDNFEECYQKWRDGEITMGKAASACGMSKTSFRGAVMRKEQATECAG